MNLNKISITFTIIVIASLIIGFTSYKIVNIHNEKLLLVQSKYIIESAKKCINEKVCEGDSITLKTLYDFGYLEVQVNSVTKEYLNEECYVYISDGNYEFIIAS